MKKVYTGTWLPAWCPERTLPLSLLLLFCSVVQSATGTFGAGVSSLSLVGPLTAQAVTTGLV